MLSLWAELVEKLADKGVLDAKDVADLAGYHGSDLVFVKGVP